MTESVLHTMDVITTQEQWVLHRLQNFYTNDSYLTSLREILNGSSTISLRILDWFVTNYAKEKNISYVTPAGKHVIVYLAYKSHLKAYSKKMFDPFCRWTRIDFHGLSTTVGQLNFFAWVIEDGILDYVKEHYNDIHADMETRMGGTETGMKKIAGTRKKRHELSHSATKSMRRHDVNVTVSFS
jgi:hypothetical protein